MYPGAHSQTTPDKPAVIIADSGQTLTYGQLDARSSSLASALHELGLRKGDGVAVLADNAAEVFEIYWATMQSGLYITPVNRNLSADEVAYIVDDSNAKVLFASAEISDLASKVRELLPTVAYAYSFGGRIAGYESYEELVESAHAPLTQRPRGADMMYSSGTTGRPKGVRAALLPIDVSEPGDPVTGLLAHVFKVGPDDVYLQPAPIYHAAPLKWSGAIHALGGTVVMMKKFDAEGALSAIEKYKVTIAQFVPTMFVRMLQLPAETRNAYDPKSLRLAVHAAAPCPPEVKQAMIDWWGPVVFEYYGSTEQHGMCFVSTPEWLIKRGSVGKPVIGQLHICDDDGAELPAGQVGSVYFERESMPFTYHNDPEKTEAARHPHHPNWTSVGDLGYVDEDGYLFLTDRKSFVIISGGVNIYPQEIENVLTLHEKIYDVAVIGVPDAEMGQSVKAVVQLKNGVIPSDQLADEIICYVRERIAHFKAPRTVDFVDDLPRTPTGKLVKRELEKTYLAQGV
ncbi:acyl-CoA synthetase [Rhodococcus sp. YH3-3]|uniref:acyl-CoA synthetase n=1 Tax=Rhodococcus sp. YH3-3 TaxID=1803579 RepID=UPI0007DAFC21|nr:acyl-CoA synthetase [Rhodococcus sp. YH3-3]